MEVVDLVVTDTPYSIQWVREDRQSNNHKVLVHDMKAEASFCQDLLKPCSDGYIFVQFAVSVLVQAIGERIRKNGRGRYVTFGLETSDKQ